jgi:hypothetical protein
MAKKVNGGIGAWIAPDGTIFDVGFHGHGLFLFTKARTIVEKSHEMKRLYPKEFLEVDLDDLEEEELDEFLTDIQMEVSDEELFNAMIKTGWIRTTHGSVDMYRISYEGLRRLSEFLEVSWKSMMKNVMVNTFFDDKNYSVDISDILTDTFNEKTAKNYLIY